jgi:hypothetical protein
MVDVLVTVEVTVDVVVDVAVVLAVAVAVVVAVEVGPTCAAALEKAGPSGETMNAATSAKRAARPRRAPIRRDRQMCHMPVPLRVVRPASARTAPPGQTSRHRTVRMGKLHAGGTNGPCRFSRTLDRAVLGRSGAQRDALPAPQRTVSNLVSEDHHEPSPQATRVPTECVGLFRIRKVVWQASGVGRAPCRVPVNPQNNRSVGQPAAYARPYGIRGPSQFLFVRCQSSRSADPVRAGQYADPRTW